MPNGYTSDIYDGKEGYGLREYLNNVARGMTMAIMQRDSPRDELVRRREVSPYYQEKLSEAFDRLTYLRSLGDEAIKAQAAEDYERDHAAWVKSNEDRAALRQRYEDMLAKVYAWHPPEIIRYVKKHAIENLISSMEFDCGKDDDDHARYYPEPQPKSPAEWHAAELAKAQKDVSYYREQIAEETQRVAEFNEHIDAFLEALPDD